MFTGFILIHFESRLHVIQVSALCGMHFTHENHMEILEGRGVPIDSGRSFEYMVHSVGFKPGKIEVPNKHANID